MRRVSADVLMMGGAGIVVLAWLFSWSPYALSAIAVGLGVATAGFLLDLRNKQRALVLAGIAVSWLTVVGFAAFAAIILLLFLGRFRGTVR